MQNHVATLSFLQLQEFLKNLKPYQQYPENMKLAALVTSEAPNLLGYNRVFAKDEAEVVATVGEDVLIATGSYGSGRTLVWTSDIGPHWCPQEFLDWSGFAPLMAGMITHLANGASE